MKSVSPVSRPCNKVASSAYAAGLSVGRVDLISNMLAVWLERMCGVQKNHFKVAAGIPAGRGAGASSPAEMAPLARAGGY